MDELSLHELMAISYVLRSARKQGFNGFNGTEHLDAISAEKIINKEIEIREELSHEQD